MKIPLKRGNGENPFSFPIYWLLRQTFETQNAKFLTGFYINNRIEDDMKVFEVGIRSLPDSPFPRFSVS